MWELVHDDGSRVLFGALEDGTVFQRDRLGEWRTLVAGPCDTDDSFYFLLAATTAVERAGAVLRRGPAVFPVPGAAEAAARRGGVWPDSCGIAAAFAAAADGTPGNGV
jgi:hypothetical protein